VRAAQEDAGRESTGRRRCKCLGVKHQGMDFSFPIPAGAVSAARVAVLCRLLVSVCHQKFLRNDSATVRPVGFSRYG
jgi:hypothetical protein